MSDNNKLDVDNPTPLYHQIASEIRRRIQAGELRPGDVLTPLREAAEEWGVHLHTVRHAYAALSREGLVESRRGPGGTRVAPGADSLPVPPAESLRELESYVRGVVAEAHRRWSLDAEDLVAAIRKLHAPGVRPVVYVVECSEHQCELHAAELTAQWNVDARPWPLSNEAPPPEGEVVATYFHYNDIRIRWPHLLERVRFVTITPDPVALGVTRGPVAVCERDRDTAEAVAADVTRVLADPDIEVVPRVISSPEEALALDATTLLFSPRVWAELPELIRNDRRTGEVRYVFDRDELAALAGALGWRAHHAQEVTP